MRLEHFICLIFLKKTDINHFQPISFVKFSTKIVFVGKIHNKVHFFIHKNHSSMDTWQIFFHINKDFVLHVKEYSFNIILIWTKYSKKDLVLLMRSCSHAHGLASIFI